jgi:hypothetical protein
MQYHFDCLAKDSGYRSSTPGDGFLRLQMDSTWTVRPIDRCATFVASLVLLLFVVFLTLAGV